MTDVNGAPATPVLELHGVSKTYADVHALTGADLTVRRGELLAVVGPSGSGKSTLLHIMGTLARPTTGAVRVDGHAIDELTDRELSALRATAIGFVFQQFHLAPGVRALDAVADGLLYSGRPLRRRRRLAEQTLRRVGLGHRLGHEPHQLSGGEKQRVAIARAVAGAPALLLADEPTGALDSRSGAAVMELLYGLHRAGTTVVVITHDREIAAALPREVRLRDGRIETDIAGRGGRTGLSHAGRPGARDRRALREARP
ncbi:ABC transporter ATP-binding protein [Streptomyces sp. WAC 06738]|uniref:ABC transporter ATP-binding protein n=1 Tax=Streptomyces sp. WAC 06738 TaxID=2203210 RepID=UPI000F6E7D48|nr:ABC transporter ATP-binding protein [Streptomyces sp. WAC 06738]AZM49658.1 ABC transporter ATP-binding protein [Streptomyces sp. WAC 06738]